MNREDLINLINDDDLGLLAIKPKHSSSITADERLVGSFLEINNFINENGREPEPGKDLNEHRLAARLKSLREDRTKSEQLLDYDELFLLNQEVKPINTLQDIFDDDSGGILNEDDPSIFSIKHVPKRSIRLSAEYIARRKPAKDFDKFEQSFIECQQNLKKGILVLRKLQRHKQLCEGRFFVVGGILGYVDKVFNLSINDQSKLNGRLRLIFENGTESNMLLQSLIKSIQDTNGWIVSERNREIVEIPNKGEDKHTGYIYIVKSLSDNPKIKSLENLYKIGFSATPVEDRIKNAVEDPTFLMAPVRIITTYECYNFNPQKLEQLLHNFFGSNCLNVDIYDKSGRRIMPREWFIAPIEAIEQVVKLIIDGGIINYRYDSQKQEIVLK